MAREFLPYFRWLALVLPIALLLQCADAPAAAPGEEEPMELGKNASIIRNPVDGGEVDSINVAKMVFAAESYDFGEIDQGAVVTHAFEFTNDGRAPLLITNARSTCGCTVPSYPKTVIEPGETGVIEVAFDTKNKSGYQEKPITLTANTYPATTTIFVTGRVQTN